MNFSEQEFENWLFSNPDAYCSSESFEWIGRQVRVASGIIDLIGAERVLDGKKYDIHVVELKAVPARSSHLTQVCRYAADLDGAFISSPELRLIQRAVIAPGDPPNELMFEADALGVSLQSVEPSFSILGPWSWNTSKLTEIAKENTGALTLVQEYADWLKEGELPERKSLEAPKDG